MAATFRIAASAGDAWLELVQADDPDTWRAYFTGLGVTAVREVYAYRPHADFAGLFRDLADHWRGWEGTKSFESIEGELRIACTHHRRGCVMIDVTMRMDLVGEWLVRGSLEVEPGHLDDLARRAALFDVDR